VKKIHDKRKKGKDKKKLKNAAYAELGVKKRQIDKETNSVFWVGSNRHGFQLEVINEP
jgi:hypothetical protein